MRFLQEIEPKIERPLIVAAMQDMGNVGNIVIDFLNKSKNTKPFRTAESENMSYILDRGGYIEIPKESWQYRYANNIIIFGGGFGQPNTAEELNALCQDVIDIARKYDAKFIYTLGGFHTKHVIRNEPRTFVTTTSKDITNQIQSIVSITPSRSVITGFNGLILGYAKKNNIAGIGLYGEINEPSIPQYRTAKSVIKTLERLTYQSFGSTLELDVLASDVDKKINSDWKMD